MDGGRETNEQFLGATKTLMLWEFFWIASEDTPNPPIHIHALVSCLPKLAGCLVLEREREGFFDLVGYAAFSYEFSIWYKESRFLEADFCISALQVNNTIITTATEQHLDDQEEGGVDHCAPN